MNTQPIEKQISERTLQVHSLFHTIQGEGPFSGMPAVFVRLAGCNLQCPLCDTEYTSRRTFMTAEDIEEVVRRLVSDKKTRLVVITGGEPFRQNLTTLLSLLVTRGYFVQIETNGTLPLSPSNHIFSYNRNLSNRHDVFIVCSPKTGRVHQSIEKYAAAYKYVMRADQISALDGLPTLALNHPAKPHVARPVTGTWPRPVYIQPADEGNEEANAANLRACVESCIQYGYVLQLQTHKLIGMP